MAVAAAFPFIEVRIDTSGLVPVAERAPGVIAVVGKSPNGANGGQAPVNVPLRVDSIAQAAELFAKVNAGVVAETPLYRSLRLAMLQDPRPSKIYGVRVNADDYAAALASLEAADDVTFVALAEEVAVGAAALTALKNHVETMSAQGQKRLGVAMIDPARQKSPTYVADAVAAVNGLKSDSSRMVLLAARGAVGDVAVAGMAAMAAYEPHISLVLKKIRGVSMPTASQYSPSEITGLSEAGINPIIDPELIVGESLHFAEGRTFTTDASLLYVDIVRTLDDIDFRLKAGLIGSVGDARITRSGMNLVRLRTEGILGPLLRRAVIAGFEVDVPVLNILSLPETAWTETDRTIVATARANRTVDMFVSITYGPAVHRLKVTLAPKF
jgi:hypothetical protein